MQRSISRYATSRRNFLELSLASLASLSSASGWAAPNQPLGTLKVSLSSNPSSLDPATGRSGTDHLVLWPMFDTLVDFEPASLQPRPGLAESWEFRDATTLVLRLRKGVVFHDGVAMDAEAVKANFAHMIGNPRSTVKADVGTIKDVSVEDSRTVILRLKEADSSLPLVLSDRAGMMSSPKAFNDLGAEYDRHPVGAGAYEFVRWDDASKIILKRNRTYWRDGQPRLEGIEFTVMTDASAGLRSVVAGQNNFISQVNPQQIPVIKRAADLKLVTNPTLYLQMIYLNFSRPPLDDVRLRQALNYAIDRVAYTKFVTAGIGEVGYTVLPSSHWGYSAKAASRYTFDPDKARKLLAEAGYPNGLELHSNHYSDPLSMQRMELIGAQLKAVGITLRSTVAAVAQANQTWNDGVGDIHLSAWTGRPDPSVTFASLFAPEGYYNKGGAEPSKELTRAIKDSRASADIEQRKHAFDIAAQLEREFALSVPLAFSSEVVAHHKSVQGYVSNLIGKARFDGIFIQNS